MADENKYNIRIECGADFVLPFTWKDINGNPYDLTGAIVQAQLRETESSVDGFDFICSNTGSGGRITITLPAEITSEIAFSYGVYDVFVTMPDGVVKRPLYGDAKIQDHVTKPIDGTLLYIVGVTSSDDLPYVGKTDRMYYDYTNRIFWRWNGTNYVSAIATGINKIEFIEHVDDFTDLYRITFDEGKTFDYTVTSKGIQKIEKISSEGTIIEGILDTYRITFNNGTSYDYTVRNGQAFDIKKTYDSAEAYDYLDMVTSGGSTYVAIQDVPAGTAITNANYWKKIIANISIGTVRTVENTTPADAYITGYPDNPKLNLLIPRGATGNDTIDDNAGSGDITHVWSANKLSETFKILLAPKQIGFVDNDSNHLIDNNGNVLIGMTILPIVDDTFTSDVYPASAKAVEELADALDERIDDIDEDIADIQGDVEAKIESLKEDVIGYTFLTEYESFGMPVMYLEHPELEYLKNKEQGYLNDVQLSFPYRGMEDFRVKVKVQGSSSANYPKKNYTVVFGEDVVLNDSWGAHTKYCLKADWVDFSHMRNEIGAKIWGQIRKTRINTKRAKLADGSGNHLLDNSSNTLAGENDKSFSMGMNLGAIDAYPILMVINGKYWGIYSVTIPKDAWMMNMTGENTYEGIVSAYSGATFKSALDSIVDGEIFDGTAKRYDVEYVPDEDSEDWVLTSLNTLINAAISADDVSDISSYVDIDSAIDYFILLCLLDHLDGTERNYLLSTWDGTKWYFTAYDMDNTFGYTYLNSGDFYKDYFRKPSGGYTFASFANTSRIAKVIYQYDTATLKARYQALRNGVLSEANIAYLVYNYAAHIPSVAYDYESLRWSARPVSNANKWEQIIDYYRLRCSVLDAEIAAL